MIDFGMVFFLARRELRRVFSRFQGGSRGVVLVVIAGALFLSYMAFRAGTTVNQGVYRVGVSPNSPIISDDRFIVDSYEQAEGQALLARGALDAYVSSDAVLTNGSERSAYALGALKGYLEEQEVLRIAGEHPLDDAFPLRIAVRYLPENEAAAAGTGGGGAPAGAAQSTGEVSAALAALSAADGQDLAVQEQFDQLAGGNFLTQFDLEDPELLVPSLADPPVPFAQVVMAFLYVMPVAFISIFFTSSFMIEKVEKRISVLLSTPLRPAEIILGKMLPYFIFSLVAVVVITLLLRGNVLLALAIFLPVILFIFAIYLMVTLINRTYRDMTFMSMLAVTAITGFLIFPAMFSGVNDFSLLSPLTLAVRMYRGQSFGVREYLFSAAPLTAVFGFAFFLGTSILNEQFQTSYRPLRYKLAEAVRNMLNPERPHLSVFVLSLLLIPIIYLIQLLVLTISLNLPLQLALLVLLFVSILFEELAKSVGIVVLYQPTRDRPLRKMVTMSLLSALGFVLGEKALLYLSLSVVSDAALADAVFGAGFIVVPFVAHSVFTLLVCVLNGRLRVRYPFALLAAAVVHMIYNLSILGALT